MQAFDAAAKTYDDAFTHSLIGEAQRRAVWSYLKDAITSPSSILELNGGTGEDALWLSENGHDVLCTDVSNPMLERAKEKATGSNGHAFQTQLLDLTRPAEFKPTYPFDLIFSNFAGLNCLNAEELKDLFQKMNAWLKPNGQAILVFLGKHCLWETGFFLLRGKSSAAFRRWTNKEVKVNVDGQLVNVWYYTSKYIEQLAAPYFQLTGQKSIGMFLPPSYLNRSFEKRTKILLTLEHLDKTIGSSSLFSNYADHFIIHLTKR